MLGEVDVELETSFWELEEPIFTAEAYDILGVMFCGFSTEDLKILQNPKNFFFPSSGA